MHSIQTCLNIHLREHTLKFTQGHKHELRCCQSHRHLPCTHHHFIIRNMLKGITYKHAPSFTKHKDSLTEENTLTCAYVQMLTFHSSKYTHINYFIAVTLAHINMLISLHVAINSAYIWTLTNTYPSTQISLH